MHLATRTPGLSINYETTPKPDTYCPKEAAALRQVVAEAHLGGDLLPTVQAAVVHAKMVHQQNWTCEARELLADFGYSVPAQPHMSVAR